MTKQDRRELTLAAGKFDASKHEPEGMLMSEKLDGSRCWWDGGITRGQPTVEVPWANIFDKDGVSLKKKIKPKSTGLWTRYGNPMIAPEWFLDSLPKNVSLDGEVYGGHGNFQYVQKATRMDVAEDARWKGLSYNSFGCPTHAQVLQDGLIKLSGSVTYIREIDQTVCLQYLADLLTGMTLDSFLHEPELKFHEELEVIADVCRSNGSELCVPVPHSVCESADQVLRLAKEVDEAGGEGMMLRERDSVWFPKRKTFILKVKPRHDAEARIVGFFAGRKGKTGQFHGKLGGLIVRYNDVEFELGTGLTHADRALFDEHVPNAKAAPNKRIHGMTKTPVFKIGDVVTFSYREFSDAGVPKEGAYLRIRNEQ